MLYLQQSRQIERWGRPLGRDPHSADPSGFGVSNGALRSSAAAIGGVATALAILAPTFIPHLGHVPVGGFGRGGGSLGIDNPMIDLQRDLIRGPDVDMITVHTDDPDPRYLRISVLNRFSDDKWTAGDRTDLRPLGELPPIQGLDPDVPTTEYDYEVQATDAFHYRWLPTQAPISRIDAPGEWRYDTTTMDFMASDDDLTTQGISYSMTAVVPELSAQAMASSSALTDLAGTQFTQLPPGLPAIVRQLATAITQDQPTRFQKAVALQDFFREDGGFEYDKKAPAGNGSDSLTAFLDNAHPMVAAATACTSPPR